LNEAAGKMNAAAELLVKTRCLSDEGFVEVKSSPALSFDRTAGPRSKAKARASAVIYIAAEHAKTGHRNVGSLDRPRLKREESG